MKHFRNGFRNVRSCLSPVNRGRENPFSKIRVRKKTGQATVEYVLLIGAVVVVLTGISTFFAGLMSTSIKTFNESIEKEISTGNDNVIPKDRVWGG